MKLDSILQLFIPKDKKFFPLFEAATANLLEISQVLIQVVDTNQTPENRRKLIKDIEHLEHVGDEITHKIFHELSTNFITPFDREDIHQLAGVLDDILDYIHGSAKRLELYKITTITPEIVELSKYILLGAEQLDIAVTGLKNLKNINKIREACVRINSIENQADDVFDRAVAGLFQNEKDAIEVIKMKEVYSALETATDKCEDAANVIESIIVKAS